MQFLLRYFIYFFFYYCRSSVVKFISHELICKTTIGIIIFFLIQCSVSYLNQDKNHNFSVIIWKLLIKMKYSIKNGEDRGSNRTIGISQFSWKCFP